MNWHDYDEKLIRRGELILVLQEDVRRVGHGEDDGECGKRTDGEGVNLQHAGADVSERKTGRKAILLKKAS